jgi:hypothetical protein
MSEGVSGERPTVDESVAGSANACGFGGRCRRPQFVVPTRGLLARTPASRVYLLALLLAAALLADAMAANISSH